MATLHFVALWKSFEQHVQRLSHVYTLCNSVESKSIDFLLRYCSDRVSADLTVHSFLVLRSFKEIFQIFEMGKVTKTTKVDKVTMSCVSSRPAKKKIQQMEPVALKKTALTKIKEGISLVPVAPPKPKQMPNGRQLVAMLPNLNRNEPAREQPQRLQKANDKENVSVQPKQKNSVPIKVYNGCKRIPSQFYMSWTLFSFQRKWSIYL